LSRIEVPSSAPVEVPDDECGTADEAYASDFTSRMNFIHRPGRDVNDIRQLLALCGITTLEEAQEHYEDFYRGDALTDRALGTVERVLDGGLPTEAPSPGPIDL